MPCVSRTYMLIPPFTTRPHNAPRIQILENLYFNSKNRGLLCVSAMVLIGTDPYRAVPLGKVCGDTKV